MVEHWFAVLRGMFWNAAVESGVYIPGVDLPGEVWQGYSPEDWANREH